jgi:hypothetical protein
MLHNVDPDTTFHDHVTAFQSPVEIPDKLQTIFDDFGAQTLAASFAVRRGIVEGVWIDPHHNYIATVFRKAAGDDDDFVMINSISRRADTAVLRVNERSVDQCIRKARAMKIQIAEEALAALSMKGSSWKSPMSGVMLIDRHASTGAIVKQIALMPITLVLLLILALLTPFAYVVHLRNLVRERAMLKDEIRRLGSSPLPLDEVSERTLLALWSHCGLSNAECPAAKLDLLCQWVDILYGSGRASELKIRERLSEIGRRMSEANRPYYDGIEGALRYHFGDPIDTVITELSEELPPFLVSGAG